MSSVWVIIEDVDGEVSFTSYWAESAYATEALAQEEVDRLNKEAQERAKNKVDREYVDRWQRYTEAKFLFDNGIRSYVPPKPAQNLDWIDRTVPPFSVREWFLITG